MTGPVFNAIAMEAARYLGIAPILPAQNDEAGSQGKKLKPVVPPSVKYAAEITDKEKSGVDAR